MSIKGSNIYDLNDFHLVRENIELKGQLGIQVEKFILDFIDNPPNIPLDKFIIAYNQMLSFNRRKSYHLEKKVLCKFYENRIKNSIRKR